MEVVAFALMYHWTVEPIDLVGLQYLQVEVFLVGFHWQDFDALLFEKIELESEPELHVLESLEVLLSRHIVPMEFAYESFVALSENQHYSEFLTKG